MKSTSEILIDLPKGRVVELYHCRESLSLWSAGFIGFQHLSGEDGAVGAVYEMKYMYKNMELAEHIRIVSNDLPNSIHTQVTYPSKISLQRDSRTRFEAVSESQTRITVVNHFQGDVVSNMVQAETEAYTMQHLKNFKDFVLNLKA